ncbi:hypothetical protein LNK82_34070 [Saccharothrix sp. NEAU-S10]|nr:hypothetical protein [Saccharothrix luteola]
MERFETLGHHRESPSGAAPFATLSQRRALVIISSGRLRVRSAVLMFAVAVLALAGTVTALARSSTNPAATSDVVAPAGVEDDGADCPVSPPGSFPSTSRLPDPFTKLTGQRITSQSDWRCRRAEIRELAERHVYGDKPAKPAGVTGTVSTSGITVNVSHNGRSASFSAGVQLPSGTGPFPAVIVYGGFGGDTATIRAAGAAIITFDPYTVGREGTPRTNKQGAFYTLYGNTSPTGLLMAWAWGVSRIIDVIESSGGTILRADIGVTGCSRFGKGAFAAGVFDQRVALTMPIESGTAGLPVYRGVNAEGGQTLSSAYGEQPWFGDAFSSYTGNPNAAPIDTHSLVAMVAPRGLFVMDNPHITNLGPRSAGVAALGGAEVYKALGVQNNLLYHSNVTDGNHCANRTEWRTPSPRPSTSSSATPAPSPAASPCTPKPPATSPNGATGPPPPSPPAPPAPPQPPQPPPVTPPRPLRRRPPRPAPRRPPASPAAVAPRGTRRARSGVTASTAR